MNNNERVALVTGAYRGLGFETCRKLGQLGYRVILTSRKITLGEEKTQELLNEGLDVSYFPLDVTDPVSITNLYEFVLSNFGRIDVLVNNAAVFLDKEHLSRDNLLQLMHSEEKSIEDTLKTNVMGPYLLCEAFGPVMQKQMYGRIVNVSSGMGQLGDMRSDYPAYRISKTALNAVTRVYADRLKPYVLVNSVCPGWVKTEMGGPNAPRSLEEGVDTIVWASTLPQGGPTGGFFRDHHPIPW